MATQTLQTLVQKNSRDHKPYIKTSFEIETLIYGVITNHN